MVRIATITLVASTRRIPHAASIGVIPSGLATRLATASCAFALAIGIAPASSAVGIEMAEQDERVGQRRFAAAAVVARRAGKGARALRTDLEDVAQLHRGDAAAAGADGFDVDGVRAQRMPRHRHLRLEQRPARQHRHVGAGPAGVEGDEILDALDVAEVAAADDAGHRPRHHGLDRRARQHARRSPRRRRISSSARGSAESAGATALPASADSARPAGRYRRWPRSTPCARIRAIPD